MNNRRKVVFALGAAALVAVAISEVQHVEVVKPKAHFIQLD
jgi:hypothetical protein